MGGHDRQPGRTEEGRERRGQREAHRVVVQHVHRHAIPQRLLRRGDNQAAALHGAHGEGHIARRERLPVVPAAIAGQREGVGRAAVVDGRLLGKVELGLAVVADAHQTLEHERREVVANRVGVGVVEQGVDAGGGRADDALDVGAALGGASANGGAQRQDAQEASDQQAAYHRGHDLPANTSCHEKRFSAETQRTQKANTPRLVRPCTRPFYVLRFTFC